MSKYVRLNQTWVESQVRLLLIEIGVTKENFKATKDAARDRMLKRVIPAALQEDRIQGSIQFSYQLRRAGWFGEGAVKRRWEEFYSNKEKELSEFAIEEIEKIFKSIEQNEFSENAAYWKLDPGDKWKPLVNRPLTPKADMSPLEAELFVNQLMLYLGAKGAEVTQFSQDGGADCISDLFIAQVKHLSKPVGVATIRETFAVGVAKQKTPIVFSKSGFTSGAVDFAIEYQVLLFSYLPFLTGNTYSSQNALLFGLEELPNKPDENFVAFEKMNKPSNRNPKSDQAFAAYQARQKRR